MAQAGNDSESEEWEFLTHSRAASPAICVPQISGEPLFDEDLLSLSHGRKGRYSLLQSSNTAFSAFLATSHMPAHLAAGGQSHPLQGSSLASSQASSAFMEPLSGSAVSRQGPWEGAQLSGLMQSNGSSQDLVVGSMGQDSGPLQLMAASDGSPQSVNSFVPGQAGTRVQPAVDTCRFLSANLSEAGSAPRSNAVVAAAAAAAALGARGAPTAPTAVWQAGASKGPGAAAGAVPPQATFSGFSPPPAGGGWPAQAQASEGGPGPGVEAGDRLVRLRLVLLPHPSSSGLLTAQLQCAPRPLTVVLLGKTGTGKSSTGNLILGRHAFEAKRRAASVTLRTQVERGEVNGRQITVIDTPGLLDTAATNAQVAAELKTALAAAQASGGDVATLLVLSAMNKYTDEEHACVEALAGHCGRGLLRRSTVVFTHGDEFENDDDELQRFLREAPTALQELLGQVAGRAVLLNNKRVENRGSQVQLLLHQMDEMLGQLSPQEGPLEAVGPLAAPGLDAARWGLTDQQRQHQLRAGSLVLACTIGAVVVIKVVAFIFGGKQVAVAGSAVKALQLNMRGQLQLGSNQYHQLVGHGSLATDQDPSRPITSPIPLHLMLGGAVDLS